MIADEERVSEQSSTQSTGERMVWRGSPSQTVNLPVYLLLGIGLVVSTAGLLFLRAGTAPCHKA